MSDERFRDDPIHRMARGEGPEYERWARAATEWGYVLRRLAEGRHPSDTHIRRLVREQGVPAWVTPEEWLYIGSRCAGEGPGVKPFRKPEHWSYTGEFTDREAAALVELTHLHRQLQAYRTTDVRVGRSGRRFQWIRWPKPSPHEPAPEPGIPLHRVERPRYWRIKKPRFQARRLVARRYGMAPDTLEDLERKFGRTPWLGQVF